MNLKVMFIVFYCLLLNLSAQDISGKINQIEKNLENKQYRQAYDKSKELLRGRSQKEKFYGRYYSAYSILNIKDKLPPDIRSFDTFLTLYNGIPENMSRNDKSEKNKYKKIKSEFQKLFFEAKLALDRSDFEIGDKSAEISGYFAVNIETEDKGRLRPIQGRLLEDLQKSYKENNYTLFVFKDSTVNNLEADWRLIPVIPTDNPRNGYSVTYRQYSREGDRSSQESVEGTISFNQRLQKPFLLKAVNEKYLKVFEPENTIRILFFPQMPVIDISGLDIVNKTTYMSDNYLQLRTNTDRQTIKIITHDQKKEKPWLLPAIIGGIGLTVLIIVR